MVTSMLDISPMSNSSLEELENFIKMALQKTGARTELDLCAYLAEQDDSLSPSKYLKLKDTDRGSLVNLIKAKVLDTDPYKSSSKAQESPFISPYAGKPLEICIREAMTKMNVLKDTALCKYIPCDEGYLHHFTFLKMKSANPIQLRNLIKQHILDRTPSLVPPKKRNRRKSREHQEQLSASVNVKNTIFDPQKLFETEQTLSNRKNTDIPQKNEKIDRLLNMMGQLIQTLHHQGNATKILNRRASQEHEERSHLDKISNRYLQVIQNQLIKKIRMKEADEELWDIFKELIII